MTSASPYIDIIGQPIAVGDTVAYPDRRGILNIAQIHAIIPLVDHPDPGSPYSSPGAVVYAREDQLQGSKRPTEFRAGEYANPAKRFVVQVMKKRWCHKRDAGGAWVSGHDYQKYTLPTTHVVRLPDGAEKV